MYDLGHQRLVEALEGCVYDDLVKIALPDDEIHSVVLEAGQLEL